MALSNCWLLLEIVWQRLDIRKTYTKGKRKWQKMAVISSRERWRKVMHNDIKQLRNVGNERIRPECLFFPSMLNHPNIIKEEKCCRKQTLNRVTQHSWNSLWTRWIHCNQRTVASHLLCFQVSDSLHLHSFGTSASVPAEMKQDSFLFILSPADVISLLRIHWECFLLMQGCQPPSVCVIMVNKIKRTKKKRPTGETSLLGNCSTLTDRAFILPLEPLLSIHLLSAATCTSTPIRSGFPVDTAEEIDGLREEEEA